MFITTSPVVTLDPVWMGTHWIYAGKPYRSLRELKTRSSYKIEIQIANALKKELQMKLDGELLDEIYKIVNGELHD